MVRLTNEPRSSAFYFNVNAYTPDGKQMVYSAPDGIHALELATRQTRLLVPNPSRQSNGTPSGANFRGGVHTIVVGRKTNSVFFSKFDSETKLNTIYKADTNTGSSPESVISNPLAAAVWRSSGR